MHCWQRSTWEIRYICATWSVVAARSYSWQTHTFFYLTGAKWTFFALNFERYTVWVYFWRRFLLQICISMICLLLGNFRFDMHEWFVYLQLHHVVWWCVTRSSDANAKPFYWASKKMFVKNVSWTTFGKHTAYLHHAYKIRL